MTIDDDPEDVQWLEREIREDLKTLHAPVTAETEVTSWPALIRLVNNVYRYFNDKP